MKRRQFITLVGGVALGGARAAGSSRAADQLALGLRPKPSGQKVLWRSVHAGACGAELDEGRNLRGIEWLDFASGL